MSTEPRLTFVCSTLNVGGAERSWTSLLPGLRDRGFDVQALTLIDEGPFFHDLRARGIPATCAWLRRRTDINRILRASSIVKAGTDLLVSQSVNAQALSVLFAKQTHVPHVTIDHAGPDVPLRLHRQLLLRLVARSADLLIGVSPTQFPRFARFGFESDRIVIIPNGIDEPAPQVDRTTARTRLGFKDHETVAILVADLRPEKKAHIFVEAMRQVHALDASVKAIVVGGGPEFAHISEACARSGGAVTALGFRQDVPDLMNAADVVCLSSESEGLPYVLLEAMALAKPVVATAVGGIVDAVVPDSTGILVPPGNPTAFADALLRLALDRQQLRRLGEAGRLRQQRLFTAKRMIDTYAETLSAVLGATDRRH